MPDASGNPTFPEIAAAYSKAVTQLQLLTGQINNWVSGAANGGANSDGYFPVTGPDGVNISIPSPAKLATMTQLAQADRDTLALADATSRNAMAEAEEKAKVWFSNSAPAMPSYGDVWFNPNYPVPQWYDGAKWVDGTSGGSASSAGGGAKATGVATIPNAPLIGDQNGTWQTAVEFTLSNIPAGHAFINCPCVQSYTSATQLPLLMSLRLSIDGQVVAQTDIQYTGNETPIISALKATDAGDRKFTLEWRAFRNTLRLTQAAMEVMIL